MFKYLILWNFNIKICEGESTNSLLLLYVRYILYGVLVYNRYKESVFTRYSLYNSLRSCSICLLLSIYCSFLFIDDRVWWMYMFVYTLYKLSMSVYGYVFVWKCKLCLSDEPALFCIHVWLMVVLFTCLDGPREDKL